eukprot:COSAG06_NODE_2385_length_6974_cov_3.851491_2_plen_183_part_00
MTEGAVRLFSTPSICGVSALFRSHTYSRYSVGGAGPGFFQFTWRQLGSSTRSWPAARPSLPRTPALRHTKPTRKQHRHEYCPARIAQNQGRIQNFMTMPALAVRLSRSAAHSRSRWRRTLATRLRPRASPHRAAPCYHRSQPGQKGQMGDPLFSGLAMSRLSSHRCYNRELRTKMAKMSKNI